LEYLTRKYHFVDVNISGRITLKRILKKLGVRRMRVGFIWLRIGTSGGLL
jgi:hypothetical protein